MSVSPFEGIEAQDDAAIVAEISQEPMYIAEAARKLLEAGVWDTSFNSAVRRVSRSVLALTEDRDEGEFRLEELPVGQQEGSFHPVMGGGDEFGGFSTSREWRDYVLFSVETDFVRDSIEAVIDRRVTFESKRRRIENLSMSGLEQARIVEDIIADVVDKVVEDADVFEVTEFNDPDVDIYVENFRLTRPTSQDVRRGKVIEITNRWENPIGNPYIDDKFDAAMEKEVGAGVPVDSLIIAPRFSGDIALQIEDAGGDVLPLDEGVVSVAMVPEDGEGIPVVVSDDESTRQQLLGSPVVGDDYPVVDRGFEDYQNDLDHVSREFNAVTESEYRVGELENVVTEFLGE